MQYPDSWVWLGLSKLSKVIRERKANISNPEDWKDIDKFHIKAPNYKTGYFYVFDSWSDKSISVNSFELGSKWSMIKYDQIIKFYSEIFIKLNLTHKFVEIADSNDQNYVVIKAKEIEVHWDSSKVMNDEGREYCIRRCLVPFI